MRDRLYRVSDRLHDGRTVAVPGHERAVCVGDWAAARTVGDQLSVDVAVIAA